MKRSCQPGLILIFIGVLFAIPTLAEVGPISRFLNQMQMDRWCPSALVTHLRREVSSRDNCSLRIPPLERSVVNLQEGFEASVMADALRRQEARERCQNAQVNFIMNDRDAYTRWTITLARLWLGHQKARLLRHHCRNEYWNRLDPTDIARNGLERAYSRIPHSRRPDVDRRLQQYCLDEDVANALQVSDVLFREAIPGAAGSDLLKLFEAHRRTITHRNTGQPLTDQELANLDLRNLSGLTVNIDDPGLRRAIQGAMDQRLQSRQDFNRNVQETQFRGRGLSQEARNHLYMEGAVHEVLQAQGLLRPPTPQAACMMARYEPNMAGALLEFGAMAGGFGAAAKIGSAMRVAVSGGSVVSGLTAGAVARGAMTSFRSGLIPAGVVDIGRAGYESCLSDLRRATGRQGRSQMGDLQTVRTGSHLGDEFDFRHYTMPRNEQIARACQAEVGAPSLGDFSMQESRVHCLRDMLLNIAPLSAALGGMLVMGAIENQ